MRTEQPSTSAPSMLDNACYVAGARIGQRIQTKKLSKQLKEISLQLQNPDLSSEEKKEYENRQVSLREELDRISVSAQQASNAIDSIKENST